MNRNLVLCIVLILSLSMIGCSKKSDNSNTTDVNETQEQTTKLESYEGVSNSDIVFDKRITFNGYTFELRSDFDKFIQETNTVITNSKELDDFREDADSTFKNLKCYILNGDDKIEFSVVIGHNNDDYNVLELREIAISDDFEFADSDYLENPNLVSCGFSVLGGIDIEKNEFTDLPKELMDVASINDDGECTYYELKLSDKLGEFEFTMSGVKEKNAKRGYIYSMIITSVPY